MTQRKIEYSLPLDPSGFLRRECPFCLRDFKIIVTEEETAVDEPAGGEVFCPYCGQAASWQRFFTREQAEYIKSLVWQEVVSPMLQEFHEDVKRTNSGSQGPLGVTFSVDIPHCPRPRISPDEDDLIAVTFACCGERVKVDKIGAVLHCPNCGRPTSASEYNTQ